MNDEAWRVREAGVEARMSRRQTLIGGAFLAAAVAGLALRPRIPQNLLGTGKLEAMVPQQIGDWHFNTASGLILPPADQLRDSIYTQLVTRTYVREGFAPVMLLIAYNGAQDGTLQIHRPEVCYPAGGFRITRNVGHVIPLDGAPVPTRAIVAENETRREQIIYWTRLGSHFPGRWIEQHMAVAAENFAGIIPDGVLVRVSSVGSGDQVPVLDRFARSLVDSVGPQMRRVLLGPAAK